MWLAIHSALLALCLLAGGAVHAGDNLADWAKRPAVSDSTAIDCAAEATLRRHLVMGAKDFNALRSMATLLEISSVFASFQMMLSARHGEGVRNSAINARFEDGKTRYLSLIKSDGYASALARAAARIVACKHLLNLP
jgi:hypothetical protein